MGEVLGAQPDAELLETRTEVALSDFALSIHIEEAEGMTSVRVHFLDLGPRELH